MARIPGAAVLALTAALGVTLGYRLGMPSSAARVARTAPSVSTVVEPAPVVQKSPTLRQPPPVAPMRKAIRAAIDAAMRDDTVDLDAYLGSLEARATAQRAVTALEVEPGIAMIRRYSSDPEQDVMTFTERMRDLQRSFEVRSDPVGVEPSERANRLKLVLNEIEHATTEEAKQRGIATYLESARALDDGARDEALERLNAVAAMDRHVADSGTVDTLWSAIGNAADPARRQVVIGEYLEVLKNLPEEEREARLTALSQTYGAERRAPP